MEVSLDPEGPLAHFHNTWLSEKVMFFNQDAGLGKWDSGWISAFTPQWDLVQSTT